MTALFLALVSSIVALEIVSLEPYKQAAQKWEDDIQKFEALDKTEVYPEDSILFVGSSSIRLWDSLAKDMAPHPVIQRGYGGAKLSDLAVYAKRIIHPHRYKALVMFVANDIAGGADDKTPNEVAGLFDHILKSIREKAPETPVFYVAITPTESRFKVWPEIQKANAELKAVCDAAPNTYFIETAKAFLNEEGKPMAKYFRDDHLHLNADGYAVWTKIIRPAVEEVLNKR